MHPHDIAKPHMAQHGRNGNRSRVNRHFHTELACQILETVVIDKAKTTTATLLQRQHIGQNIHLVVIGQGQHQIGIANTRFRQDFRRQPTALQDDGFIQFFRHKTRPLRVRLNQTHGIATGLRIQGFCNLKADIAAADNHQTPRFAFRMAENLQCPLSIRTGGDEKGFIAGLNRIVKIRHINFIISTNADGNCLQIGKQSCQLIERRINNRTVLLNRHPDHFNVAAAKTGAVKRAGQGQAPHHGLSHFRLR